MSVIDPPFEEKLRENFIVMNKNNDQSAEINTNARTCLCTSMPWRTAGSVGVMLDNVTQVVRANYFKMKPSSTLPKRIFNYRVGIYRMGQNLSEERKLEDLCSGKGEKALTTAILRALIASHSNWHQDSQGNPIGLAYNGTTTLYTTHQLDNSQVDVNMPYEANYGGYTFNVVLTETSGSVNVPRPNAINEWRDPKNFEASHALDISLLSFARWEDGKDVPNWILSGSKAFKLQGTQYSFGSVFLGRLGFYASLKCTLSGLAMISEVSVGCFLKGGNLVDVMANVGGYRNIEDMLDESRRFSESGNSGGLPPSRLHQISEVLKGARVKLIHLGHGKKIKSFGPSANAKDSSFDVEGEDFTVEEYYQMMATKNSKYMDALRNGRLKSPTLPTANFGSNKKAVLVPAELIYVVEGQSRQRGLPAEIANNIIKYAAQAPDVRFDYLTRESKECGVLDAIQSDPNAIAFGVSEFYDTPMKVQACILPPAKLKYGNRTVEPELRGSWNLSGGIQFAHPAKPSPGKNTLSYGLIVTYDRSEPNNIDRLVGDFQHALEHESRNVGIPLQLCTRFFCVKGSANVLDEAVQDLKRRGAQIVVALLHWDVYSLLKVVADRICLPSQCVKWSNVIKPPRNYHTSLLVKMNYKMGGINHTLASRMPRRIDDDDSFQSPPKSISWLFDEPCMVMGVDVNHPEINGAKGGSSVAAVVGSTDGMLGQYCAHISAIGFSEGPVSGLEESVGAVLDTFCQRNNGNIPRRIVVYRDGVADNQFHEVLEKELAAYKDALNQRGYNEDSVQIALVICQKRHHTRLVYDSQEHGYLNPCVGLCVDARTAQFQDKEAQKKKEGEADEVGSISSPGLNEFYLNSHAAVLGTSKPCKYTLIYDEIGIKMTELELLTFWLTHLYARCTRSVSYATPAYYAHWAAKRGKSLLSGGADAKDLVEFSNNWMKESVPSLYFV
eukprot:gene3414-3741_t